MFQLEANGLTGIELNRAIRQFDEFQKNIGQLPCFSISFFHYDPTDCPSDWVLLREITGFQFYLTNDGYAITYGVIPKRRVCIRLSSDFTHADAFFQEDTGETTHCDIADLLYHGYRYRAVTTGNMMIHAAAVRLNRDGILFCGMHAAGKSTQANLWQRYLGAEPLNFDQPCILASQTPILVHGSPWSGKEQLFLNESAPLKAIVFVEKSAENKAIPVSRGEAFSLLYLNNYLLPLTEQMEEQYYAVIQKIVQSVPVYRLHCTISEEAVQCLYEAIYHQPYKEFLP